MPQAVRERLRAGLHVVPMPAGKVVYEAGEPISHVYFPLRGCIVSKMQVMLDGSSAEVAIVGHEGVVGVAAFMGGGASTNRAIVVNAGEALRLDARVLVSEFNRSADLQMLLLRYTQALITQLAQTTVCNRHHSVVQRLCRFLLASLDRLPSTQLRITQETIAQMLGVRREGVTEAALGLQARNVIHYRRGVIEILDRPALEKRACECYAVVAVEYERLLPEPAAARPAAARPLSSPSLVPPREWLCATA